MSNDLLITIAFYTVTPLMVLFGAVFFTLTWKGKL